MTKKNNLLWIDLEMTGLDDEIHHIIEIASIITDQELNILAEGPVIAIYQPDSVLNLMDEWNQSTHKKSGLIDRIKASTSSIDIAEKETLKFIEMWLEEKSSPLCGNSIGTDRRFLNRHMPKLHNYCHYRNIDVSSFKEMITRWYPEAPQFSKENKHSALDDISESIQELKFYHQTFFK